MSVHAKFVINKDTMNKVKGRLGKFRKHFAEEFVTRVADKTPVDTGLLQASWGYTLRSAYIRIVNPVHYADYVENGTPFMAPRAMLARTIREVKQIVSIAVRRAKQ